ncbi:GNAT family N-acetyltransferase [Eisenibacter elegans]|uniref:GNAT family N-acetyltransferase n=1 Tax=Eisenibacter elegans TaxID=997 RepID=UPI000427F63F|nr:GNAT family N-acetyltransferase [Eisenibacter elegans]
MNNTSPLHLLEIIPCTPKTLPLISEVGVRAYTAVYRYLWDDAGAYYLQHHFSAAVFAQEATQAEVQFYGIYWENTPVGLLKLNRNRPQARSLELERLYLIPEVTGKGLGTAVVNYCKAVAKAEGFEAIWLKAMDSSPSVDFYLRQGFKKTNHVRIPFPHFLPQYRGAWEMCWQVA